MKPERGLFEYDISEHSGELDVLYARRLFRRVNRYTSPVYFSFLVHQICGREDLTDRQKYDVLHTVVCRFNYLLTSEAVIHYLHTFPDTVFGRRLFKSWRDLVPTDRHLTLNCKETWLTEALFKAMQILSPDDLKQFAILVLKKFPHLPGWTSSGEHIGSMRHYQNLAGVAAPTTEPKRYRARLVKPGEYQQSSKSSQPITPTERVVYVTVRGPFTRRNNRQIIRSMIKLQNQNPEAQLAI